MGSPAPRMSKGVRRNLRWGLLFISPWIVGFLAFIVYPTLASLFYSFTDFSITRSPEWLGLANYSKLFLSDNNFRQSLYNTLYMVSIQIPLGIVLSFTCAILLDLKVRGRALYRTIFYLPSVVPPIAASLLWVWILNPQQGIINDVLKLIGMHAPGWFADPHWSKPGVIVMGLWGIGGSVVLYLAALQGVPQGLYEAATLDGANWLQRTLNITIPLVSPVTLFMLITGIIDAFQIFTPVYIVNQGTSGAPQGSLLFYCLYLFANAFNYMKMGYAAAMAWILFVIIILVTIVMLRTSTIWTHYDI